ncbi:MAG: DEAD/DEAH box helicase [Phycisphaerales bacterium]|nr:DEAD/DEAH box helicase [Phycisphaerales bacterium]
MLRHAETTATPGIDSEPQAVAVASEAHPFAISGERLMDSLNGTANAFKGTSIAPLALLLPHLEDPQSRPDCSLRLATALGLEIPDANEVRLHPTTVESIRLPAWEALKFLANLDEVARSGHALLGHDIQFWSTVAEFVSELLCNQRFVPSIIQRQGGPLRGRWVPWLADAELLERLELLAAAMPPVTLAAVDNANQDRWAILEHALESMTDAAVRRVLVREDYGEAIESRDPDQDRQVAWLKGLLGDENVVPCTRETEVELLRGARMWLGGLQAPAGDRAVQLCLQLAEPLEGMLDGESVDLSTVSWPLSFHLVVTDDPPIVVSASQIWADGGGGRLVELVGSEQTPGDLLLAELARVDRIWPRMNEAMEETNPIGLDLSTADAHTFLRDIRPILQEAGVEVLAPSWWGSASSRIGVRMLLDPTAEDSGNPTTPLGLSSLVDYAWEISIGDESVTLEELRRLTESGGPLVRVGDQWVEVRADDFERARTFLERHPGGQMTLGEAMRLAAVGDEDEGSLAISGVRCSGWIEELLGGDDDDDDDQNIDIPQPDLFRGTLRPYQQRGLSWLAFLDRFGLGACLADDMGLGKTIQLIAMLQHERAERANSKQPPKATLLVCPMSVMGNWCRELERFAPELRVQVQHGIDRLIGEPLAQRVNEVDVVITTYTLVSRDRETLVDIDWERVVLDEAQHIKNPPTKQATAIRSLNARHRVALTGTPVENRLSELWSIIEFCLPGFLGSQGEFRRRFALPIERHGDEGQTERLRRLVGPFILRRLKTDPGVVDDLPPLVESRQHVPLTAEQAQLYDQVVEDMLKKVDEATGIRRRGLVLSGLVKLKQICNHPAHFLKENHLEIGTTRLAARSGKSIRLVEMLEEALATNDKALVFTQYRQMGHLLSTIIRQEFDVETLFLHGGTPQRKRDEMIDRFQTDSGLPVFILSLKAGGVGVNLTAANHVFHFDRWWNPAVENQATDRAFRIGQTRTVHVHKMITNGTLEERIDQMIEQKSDLAKRIIGTGEAWLTELSSSQLREVLSLRESAIDEEAR